MEFVCCFEWGKMAEWCMEFPTFREVCKFA